MGDTGFRVHPEALGRYANLLDEQAEQLARIQSIVSGIHISSGAFGHLPNAQNLAHMYQEHADASRQNIGDLGEGIGNTGEALGNVATNYAEHDEQLSAGLGGGA